ncbi:MAG: hypothetical protein V2A62_04225, partial [Candidatus Woesearchaeota archaeon]
MKRSNNLKKTGEGERKVKFAFTFLVLLLVGSSLVYLLPQTVNSGTWNKVNHYFSSWADITGAAVGVEEMVIAPPDTSESVILENNPLSMEIQAEPASNMRIMTDANPFSAVWNTSKAGSASNTIVLPIT